MAKYFIIKIFISYIFLYLIMKKMYFIKHRICEDSARRLKDEIVRVVCSWNRKIYAGYIAIDIEEIFSQKWKAEKCILSSTSNQVDN